MSRYERWTSAGGLVIPPQEPTYSLGKIIAGIMAATVVVMALSAVVILGFFADENDDEAGGDAPYWLDDPSHPANARIADCLNVTFDGEQPDFSNANIDDVTLVLCSSSDANYQIYDIAEGAVYPTECPGYGDRDMMIGWQVPAEQSDPELGRQYGSNVLCADPL